MIPERITYRTPKTPTVGSSEEVKNYEAVHGREDLELGYSIENLKKISEEHPDGGYWIEVIELIVAVPDLMRTLPTLITIIGNVPIPKKCSSVLTLGEYIR
jgi:hypothetical protein